MKIPDHDDEDEEDDDELDDGLGGDLNDWVLSKPHFCPSCEFASQVPFSSSFFVFVVVPL